MISRRYRLTGLLIAHAISVSAHQQSVSLANTGLELHGTSATVVQYRGRPAVRLIQIEESDEPAVAILKDVVMRDGTIEAEVSGAPLAGAGETARGFIGIAFRVEPEAKRFEYIYLRPTNGRASDQVRRNHSVQYASHPDYPWQRLRKEEPEKYETYTDLEPGVWTKIRLVIAGPTARLYVNDAVQPTLIVNDLKLGAKEGGIALWIGPGTEGYFSDVRVSAK